MSNFKTRLLDEQEDLNRKIVKLEEFLKSSGFNSISAKQQTLLLMQKNKMSGYLDILNLRINELKRKGEIA